MPDTEHQPKNDFRSTIPQADLARKAALHFLLEDLHNSYPQAVVCGHRDFPNVRKDCPCYDARKEHQFKERIY